MQRVDFLGEPSNFLVLCFRNFDSRDLGLRDLGHHLINYDNISINTNTNTNMNTNTTTNDNINDNNNDNDEILLIVIIMQDIRYDTIRLYIMYMYIYIYICIYICIYNYFTNPPYATYDKSSQRSKPHAAAAASSLVHEHVICIIPTSD